MKKKLDYTVYSPARALMILGLMFIVCLVLLGILTPLLLKAIHRPEAALRIATVAQDLLLFIVPAFGVALLSTRLPARMLGVDRGAPVMVFLGAIVVMIVSNPLMEAIIEWNESWHLPQSMAGLENWLRNLEVQSQGVTETLLGGHTVGALIMSLLIVSVLAGFSEELFFRGAMLRILMATRINIHVAIWLVAFIFSAFHFQISGFVPRLLLGAYFGYLLWWTKSLWVPVTVHILNNAAVVLITWSNGGVDAETSTSVLPEMPLGMKVTSILISAALTAFALRYLYLSTRTPERPETHLSNPAD